MQIDEALEDGPSRPPVAWSWRPAGGGFPSDEWNSEGGETPLTSQAWEVHIRMTAVRAAVRTRRTFSSVASSAVIALLIATAVPAGAAPPPDQCSEKVQVRQGSERKPIWRSIQPPTFPEGLAPDGMWVGRNTIWSYAPDPFYPDRLYAADYDTLLRSDDAGCTWKEVFALETVGTELPPTIRCDGGIREVADFQGIPGCAHIASIDIAPPTGGQEGRIYVQVYTYWASTGASPFGAGLGFAYTTTIFRSDDGGATFKSLRDVSADGIASQAGVGELVIAPSDPATIYVTRADWGRSSIYVSHDHGATWTFQGIEQSAFNTYHLQVRPDDPNELWGTQSLSVGDAQEPLRGPRLLRSGDGGRTWQEVEGPFEVALDVSIAPSKHGTTVVVTEPDKIWVSLDGAKTWEHVPACRPSAKGAVASGKGGTTFFVLCESAGVLRFDVKRRGGILLTTFGTQTDGEQSTASYSEAAGLFFLINCGSRWQAECSMARYSGRGT